MTARKEILDRYLGMSTDDLLHISNDRKDLTPEAYEVLLQALQTRRLDNSEALQEYQRKRDEEIENVRQLTEAQSAHRSIIHRLFVQLKGHPLIALLTSVFLPGLAYIVGYGMVKLRVGNGRILCFSVSLMLFIAGICAVAAARSNTNLGIRLSGTLVALITFMYAFIFLFWATVGVG